jgi:hypothetical protein
MLLQAIAAPHSTAVEKLEKIPPAFWIKLGIAVLVLVGVVIVLRKLAHVNRVLLTVIVVIILSTVGFNWIYQRNEPAWATPVVSKLADFFPTKGAYNAKQKSQPRH